MADQYKLVTGSVSVTASGTKTIAMLTAPADERGKVKALLLSVDAGAAGDAAARVRICRFSSAGTGTSTTPVPKDPAAPASTFTGARDFSAEPTISDTLGDFDLPRAGGSVWQDRIPLGDEHIIPVSGRWGVVVTAGGQNIAVRCEIEFEH